MNAVVTLPEQALRCGLSALVLHLSFSSNFLIQISAGHTGSPLPVAPLALPVTC